MSNVVHRTTLEYRISVNLPDYDPSEWLIDPDLSRVRGVPHRYWKINSRDQVVEMSRSEKDAVDAQISLQRIRSVEDRITIRRASDDTLWDLEIAPNGTVTVRQR